MTVFEYRAIDDSGQVHTGTMDGVSPENVRIELDRAGMIMLSARQIVRGARTWRERLTPEPPSSDITRFTQDLAMLLRGGVSLDEALSVVAKMETRRWLVTLTRHLQTALAAGKSFSSVLAEHPRYFSPLYVKMVQAAEASGRLQHALAAIARERQRSEALRRRLISATAYPGFLAVAATGVMFFVLLYIIPQFEGAIAGFRDRLAPSTLFVFRLSEGLRENLDVVLIGMALLLVVFIVAKRIAGRASVGQALIAKAPFVNRIVSYNLTLTFCAMLAMLNRNGVDISTSLGLIRDTISLPGAERKFDEIIADVRSGARLSDALARSTLFPAHVVQMLRVGEGAGNLAESGDRIAEFYEVKLDTALKQLTAVLGPALMMLVSVMVGWLIISVMGALMSINDLLI
ncbi:type II secretion system F family protein [Mesorhizobium sp. CAU 1741]|uniref:type II secretion system F family protein n=1 Tax=Mesorhizobium sp. CAU 1741 TaxID=3140366 RepID=UPI00325C0FC8